MLVCVIDLGVSNIRSLTSALSFLGVVYRVTNRQEDLADATHVILPGVGAYDAAMRSISVLNLADALRHHALTRKLPLLGVCLGMQLLFEGSEEGELPGLCIMQGRFKLLQASAKSGSKVPHVGFSPVYDFQEVGLFSGFAEKPHFYFTHSFAMPSVAPQCNAARCDHAQPFVAAFQQDNVCGAQFHPEKSQSVGLRLLSNFIELSGPSL
jgi:imidazole glycerol-phosphate synthase subunit HisH